MGFDELKHLTVFRHKRSPRRHGLRDLIVTALATTGFTIVYMVRTYTYTYTYTSQSTVKPRTDFLHLKPDGSFQLGILSDLHFGEAQDKDWGPLQDSKTTAVVNKVLETEAIDFAVLNGDLVSGSELKLENATSYIDHVVAPLVQRGMRWGSAYGNHDSEYNITHLQIYHREHMYPGCMTGNMVAGHEDRVGVSNYYLPVYASDQSDADVDPPELILWFFDSRAGVEFQRHDPSLGVVRDEVPRETWVHQDVIGWFKHTAAELTSKHKRQIPSVAFVHITIGAARYFQKASTRDPELAPGIDEEAACVQGNPYDNNETHYRGQDIPFMSALLEAKQKWGLQAVLSGHDHGLSWCYKWDTLLPNMTLTGNGLNVCFAAISGYGGYGTWLRGSRQIIMRKNSFDFETYIRYEDGSINNHVVLNSTYGKDRYPVVPVRRSYLRDSDRPAA